MINVLVVEDQRMAQENMEAIIKASDNYTLAGIIPNAADTELFCMRGGVDLILMDVCTARDENGIEACAVIKKKFPKIKVIVVTSMAEHTFLEKAKEARADSFWYKDASHGELISVMDRTMAGEHIFPDKTPEVKLGLITSYKAPATRMRQRCWAAANPIYAGMLARFLKRQAIALEWSCLSP